MHENDGTGGYDNCHDIRKRPDDYDDAGLGHCHDSIAGDHSNDNDYDGYGNHDRNVWRPTGHQGGDISVDTWKLHTR
jgi:hypothetical protein